MERPGLKLKAGESFDMESEIHPMESQETISLIVRLTFSLRETFLYCFAMIY